MFYKLSFGNTALALSNTTLKEVAQVFRNAHYTNFTVDNSSITIAGTSAGQNIMEF